MYATLKMARDALETAADKMLEDYRTWVADDVAAKPRYGQIPAYDAVNAAVRECEDALCAAPTVARQQCGMMDEVAMIAARYAYADSGNLEIAIRAYLEAATPPDAAGLIDELADEADLCRNETATDIADLLDRAATALRLSAGGGWRSIESAPHGVNVLLAYWDEALGGWHMEAGMASWGWRRDGVSNMSAHGQATHWQPLPLPPASPTVEGV